MNQIDELLSQLPIGQIAAQLGVGEEEASTASRSALGALLDGLGANAQDPRGEASLLDALGQHGQELDGGVDLGSIDTNDGQRIVDHIFGDRRDAVIDRLQGHQGSLRDLLEGRADSSAAPARQAPSGGGGLGGALGGGMLAKLLPLLAPLVMAWLSKKMRGGATSAGARSGSGGGGLGDILGGGGGGGLGDILGDLLGGGRRA